MFTHKTKCILSIKASEDRPVLDNTVMLQINNRDLDWTQTLVIPAH